MGISEQVVLASARTNEAICREELEDLQKQIEEKRRDMKAIRKTITSAAQHCIFKYPKLKGREINTAELEGWAELPEFKSFLSSMPSEGQLSRDLEVVRHGGSRVEDYSYQCNLFNLRCVVNDCWGAGDQLLDTLKKGNRRVGSDDYGRAVSALAAAVSALAKYRWAEEGLARAYYLFVDESEEC